jgi:TetR/AcrR family tetracycline transcriptional repressor
MPQRTRERLSRERVVEAAIQVMDAEGLEAVSMRRVAREVGVEAMSLYHHVRDKDDLLDAMAIAIMRGFDAPAEAGDWADHGREVARAWRRLLKVHPNAIALFAERHRPLDDVEALRPMEVALRALGEAGLSHADAVQAFHAIGGYIFGFVAMEMGGLFGPGVGAGSDPNTFAEGVALETLPCVAAALPYLVRCDFDEQFEFGLDLMIEGLRAKVAAPTG